MLVSEIEYVLVVFSKPCCTSPLLKMKQKSPNIKIFSYHSIQIYQYPISQYSNINISILIFQYRYSNIIIPISEHSNVSIFQYLNILISQYSNISIFQYIIIQISQYSNISIFQYLECPVFQFSNSSIFQYLNIQIT